MTVITHMKQEADISGIVSLHEQVKEMFHRREGIRLTYMPFFLNATVNSLKVYPVLNTVKINDRPVVRQDIHISLVTAARDCPVLKHADQKSIAGFAVEMDRLFARARYGDLTSVECEGGTFAVAASAAFGFVLTDPIIRPPQASLLTFEIVSPKPVAVDDAIVNRHKINLSLTLDTDAIEETVCHDFLVCMKRNLEDVHPHTLIY